MQPLLEVRHVSFSYHTIHGETPALSDIHFSLSQGEFAAIVGPSGCGKSTLLSLISGLLAAESGQILLRGKNVKGSNTGIGYMLQKDHLFEWRTIRRNALLGLEIQKRLTPENLRRVDDMLDSYGLGAFKNARPSQLSGGMRQRAALIRTLALEPDLLLLDEPFSALDYQTRLSVGDDIGSIIKKERQTALLVTHDLSEAISMADRVIVLSKRPARIRQIVPIVLSIPDRTPMKSRSAPEFKDYFNLIWEELNRHD
ncbi:MAG TPA: ABC transporter ATP-binding protein [Candidatus Limivivens intestinipullorum]|uniref:ABC transporter ATP-binding protein n=1 Tax=Candidatus Limivivens intestinipullorum TaxID=2840858 RepID=A0A9D1ET10_9FIRM|nr:ABC transporter ATP-binding protein [Candidatus Limivivens intestinipullorum]